MPQYTVKQGDSVSSIAYEHGIKWEKIWNDPNNAELKSMREDPNVLNPGDQVFIPEKQDRQESGTTDQSHRFRIKGASEQVRIVLLDEVREPRANASYTLIIDGDIRTGTTDGSGLLQEDILPNAKHGVLVVFDAEGNELDRFELALGYLNPITEISGIQMRLTNLGFDCSSEYGSPGSRTEQAIRSFQQAHELEATGEVDDATRQKLREIYGC